MSEGQQVYVLQATRPTSCRIQLEFVAIVDILDKRKKGRLPFRLHIIGRADGKRCRFGNCASRRLAIA